MLRRVSWAVTASVHAWTMLVVGASVMAMVAAFAAAAAADGLTYFVDCDRGDDASSGATPEQPWRTLGRVSSAEFGPGDTILFQRGMRCEGVLEAKGSGTPDAPIVVSAYGQGAKPELAGMGAPATVFLHDVEGWELRDLAVSNDGAPPQLGELRIGILVRRDSGGVGRHYVVEAVDIHDVESDTTRPLTADNGRESVTDALVNYGKNSGGIVFVATGSNGFADVSIEGNTLERVNRVGIVTFPLGPRMTGLVIRGNSMRHVGGDGIILVRAEGALVERNLLDGWNEEGLKFAAGMWPWDSDDVTFQFNEVARGAHAPLDAQAFDLDGGNRRITYQYNFSHDNSGGALLVCANPPGQRAPEDLVFRYNVSQNDGAVNEGAPVTRGVIDAPDVGLCGRTENVVHIYNNTIFTRAPSGVFENESRSSIRLTNNIFVGASPLAALFDPFGDAGWDSNLYVDVNCIRPPGADPGAVIADPRFVAPGTATSRADAGGYRLRQGSPALGAGVPVSDDGGLDYYGNPIPLDSPIHIGAYQGPGVATTGGEATLPALAPGC